MMNDDLEYRKYLESVFEDDWQYYYVNLETREEIPETEMLKKPVKKVDADYLLTSNTVMGPTGQQLFNFVNVINMEEGTVLLHNGNKNYIFNLYLGKNVFETDLKFKERNNGFFVFLKKHRGSLVISPNGKVIYNGKEYPLSVDEQRKEMTMTDFKKILIDVDERYSFGYLENRKQKIYEKTLADDKDLAEIHSLLNTFNVPKTVRNELEIIFSTEKYWSIHFKHNDSFLEIHSNYGEAEEKCWVLSKNKELFNKQVIKKAISISFNDKIVAIYDKKNSKCVSYYDASGNLLSRFIDASNLSKEHEKSLNWLKMDKHFYQLYIAGTITEIQRIDDKIKFKIGDKFYYYKYNGCISYDGGRLLVQDDNSLYGYLDTKGNEVIETKYINANNCGAEGIARVSDVNTKNQKIDVFGNPITYDIENMYFGKGKEFYEEHFEKTNDMPLDKRFPYIVYETHYNILSKRPYRYYDIKSNKYLKVKFHPIRLYENFLICYTFNKFSFAKIYYALNLKTKKFMYLAESMWDNDRLFYDDYFILTGKNYYPCDRIINVGYFNLTNRKLKKGVRLVSRDEYLKTRKIELLEESIKEKTREEQKSELEAKKRILLGYQKEIEEHVNSIEKLQREISLLKLYHLTPIPKNFFIKRNNVEMINPAYIADLKYYDLLTVDFKDCLVSGIDFSDTNACLNPQEVYNKDMSNGNYSDVTILNYDMTGVNIENAIFNNDFINAYQEGMLKRGLTKKKKEE